MKQYITKDFFKRAILMFVSVIIMGICVFFLNRTNLGPDPCSAVNYAVSSRIGMSFGTYQLIVNIILFLFTVVQDKTLFGLGTLGNMIVVGYSADFTGWVVGKMGFLPENMTLTATQSVMIMIPTLAVFLMAAALYMNCGLGTSPYDALPVLIHHKLEKATEKTIPFRFVRMAYDGAFTLAAFFIGGGIGIVTVLMVFTLGPAVDLVGKVVGKLGIFSK